ncbi:MAG: copper oxidase [Bryobacteraceae bacterium]|nr:copper oxidase [Bryobacteraceae bacterium]
MSQRRDFFKRFAGMGAAFWAGARAAAAQQHQHGQDHASRPLPQKASGPASGGNLASGVPVETPDLPKLPHKMVDGWKEFHLIAEVVQTELVPGRVMHAWGYNGSIPGPTIEVNQGDKVRVVFENKLPEMTAVHWHGFEVPMEMDGSVGLGQDPVPPGGKFIYEWELHQAGTFFYHSHFPMQEMMGMLGLFIMHPQEPFEPRCQRDFGIVIQEWALLANNTVPNTLSMEFNWLTFNGKAGPATTPMIVKQGERVRIRLVNIGMDHHPIHLHGTQFVVTGTEGGRSPVQTWLKQNTVIVGVAQARDIEFDAKYIGDWMLHCHLPHHMMNQMVSMVGPISHGGHGHGIGTGAGMEEGMGMLTQGSALSEEFGPSMGRGLGLAADSDRSTSNLVGQGQAVTTQAEGGHSGHGTPAADQVLSCAHHPEVRGKAGDKCPKCGMALVAPKPTGATAEAHDGHGSNDSAMDMYPKDDPEKKKIPGYPQDMWMVEDEKYNWKPENYGLRKGWSGGMMGMMTMVRVVTPEVYDKIMELRAANPKSPQQPSQPAHQHGAGAPQKQ